MRVIMWIVSVVNTDVSTYSQLNKSGWLIKNGIGQSGVIKWWHGRGSFIDYFNDEAVFFSTIARTVCFRTHVRYVGYHICFI
jgi:alpha-glucosidase (family GH31 glycosyl hydrolase)